MPPNVLWWQNWLLPLLRTIDLGQTLGSASGKTEAQGDKVTWRNPTPDVQRQPPPATRPCFLRRPLQVHSDVTWTGLIVSRFLRPRTRLIFTRVNICDHSSCTVGSLTLTGPRLSPLGLRPTPTRQTRPSQPMRPGGQTLFIKDRCCPQSLPSSQLNVNPKWRLARCRREGTTKPPTRKRVWQFL